MKPRRPFGVPYGMPPRVPLAALAALLPLACHRPLAPVGLPSPAPSAAPALAPAARAELEALYRARQDSALRRYGPADVAFMTGMVAHHAQALAMANLAARYAAAPAVRTLASRIHNAQQDEIALMQQWLRRRGEPVPALHVDDWRVMVHGGGDHAAHAGHGGMPGMLTEAELTALAEARGAAFDRLFLTSMIRHHEGAVVMVDRLFATDGAAQDETVFKFASDVQVDQRTEVARMRLMLDALR
jgi:uncharacterized protein (DUF305 family)